MVVKGSSPVVGRREDGDALAVVGHLVAAVLDLVAADDVLQLVELQEALGHVGAKLAAHPALAGGAAQLGLRVGPEELAHHACEGGRLKQFMY